MRLYKRFLMWALGPVLVDIEANAAAAWVAQEADIEALRKGAGFMKAYGGAVARMSDGKVFSA
ncbi:hypothetical protein [Pantoea sp. 18069]|uniref:hypothetical protein n=1 Tax=Pantoea sp. 18069 TaxID=2681415 RepID=UPI001358F09B|nr:hypothetical protein [Pantoea sp. 18069]